MTTAIQSIKITRVTKIDLKSVPFKFSDVDFKNVSTGIMIFNINTLKCMIIQKIPIYYIMKYNRASYKLLPLKHIKYNLKMLVIV